MPKTVLAQPAGTVCPASTDPSDAEFGVLFTSNVQNIPDLDNALCTSGINLPQGYGAPGFPFPDTFAVFNNVLHVGATYTAGFSVVVGANVTNLRLDGAPYATGTQIALTTAGAFTGTFQFDFGGSTFQITVVKPAASNTIQGFTVEEAPATATNSPLLTERVINNFMVRRAEQIIANGPDIAARLTDRGDTVGGSPADVGAGGEGGSFDFAFATGFRRIASARSPPDTLDDAHAAALAFTAPPPGAIPETAAPANGFDLWVEGTWSRLDSGGVSNDLAMVHVGTDYRISNRLLIGVLGQFDWSDEDTGSVNARVDGFGWMAGPYVAARVHEHLIFDARAAWGRSHNDISPTGTYTDSFDTERWLASGGLTGDIRQDGWHFTPGVRATYFEERQDSYTDSLGVVIRDQTIALGQLAFGPEATRTYRPAEDWVIRPRIRVKGIWTFTDTDVLDVATGAAGGRDELRMRTEGGISVTYDDRYTLTAEGFHDGLAAADYSAFGGRLAIDMRIADGVLLTGEGAKSAGANFDAEADGGLIGRDRPAGYVGRLKLRLRLP